MVEKADPYRVTGDPHEVTGDPYAAPSPADVTEDAVSHSYRRLAADIPPELADSIWDSLPVEEGVSREATFERIAAASLADGELAKLLIQKELLLYRQRTPNDFSPLPEDEFIARTGLLDDRIEARQDYLGQH